MRHLPDSAAPAITRARIARGELRMIGAPLGPARSGSWASTRWRRDDGAALFQNVNTPHDYARARDLVELDEKPFEDRITE